MIVIGEPFCWKQTLAIDGEMKVRGTLESLPIQFLGQASRMLLLFLICHLSFVMLRSSPEQPGAARYA